MLAIHIDTVASTFCAHSLSEAGTLATSYQYESECFFLSSP